MKIGRGYAVSAAVIGAGLALFAASRIWRYGGTGPVGIPGREQTGGHLVPWLPALALAGLAGAGAVFAVHGLLRRTVGALLVLFGIAIAGGGVYGLIAGVSARWAPAATFAGGALLAVAGTLTVLHGGSWPAMSSRYQRDAAEPEVMPAADDPGDRPNPIPPPGSRASMAMWDALDRGEDPTR
jgi:Tryptophan-associated transmembrane protein (Trp_oprn_chp)